MPEAWVVNASPIISLAKAGHLDLLREPDVPVLLPLAVAAEIESGPSGDPGRRALQGGFGRRTRAPAPPAAVLEWGLGRGETSVISLAMRRPGAVAVLDDAQARTCARTLGVELTGTVGLVVRAALAGRIESAEVVLRDLRRAGLFLSDALVERALQIVSRGLQP